MVRVDSERGGAALDTARARGSLHQRSGEQLVALRPDILNDAEHALGNLFQRVFHVTRMAREELGPYADRLSETLQDLERVVELVFDYVSPVELALRPTNCARVAESLAAQVRIHVGERLVVGSSPSLRLLADVRLLGRSFQLIGRALARELRAASAARIQATHNEALERVEFALAVDGRVVSGPTAEADLALAVAARLVELQGGELQRAAPGDARRWAVSLPVSEGGNA